MEKELRRITKERTAMNGIEVFFLSSHQAAQWNEQGAENLERGWYWWACFPGCLPDSDPTGPFDSRREAEMDAEETCE